MKRLFSLLLLCAVLLNAAPGLAGSAPFEDDYEAIDRAAKSVLMLLVYSAGDNDYQSTGSGFVAFDNQTLITNYHVVEGGNLVLAESDDGESFFLDQVIAFDKEKDLAILRFKAPTGLSPLPLYEGERLLRGQPVVAIGSPEGYKNTVSKGDISSFSNEDNVRYIHFTAPISHGSSGGALFNATGEVIGITSASLFGSTQNMNFAIDISEAIALYAGAGNKTPFALSALGAEYEKPVTERGSGDEGADRVKVSGLSATQIAPDKAEVTWQSPAGPESWFVGYEIEQNAYFSYEETDRKALVIEDLVPGETYTFFVSDSLDGLDLTEERVTLTMDEPKPFDKRGILVLDAGLYYSEKEQWIDMPLKPGLTQITTGQLYRAMADMKLSFIYRLKLEESLSPSSGSCLYVLYSPSGKVYKQEHLYEFSTDRNSYLRTANLQDALDTILKYEQGFETGGWRAAVYHDGALIAQTGFEVTEDQAGERERESGGKGDDPFVVSVIRGNAYLDWAGLDSKGEYAVYRSNAEDGHYFFLESTRGTFYLDEKVFSNRDYYYKISYTDESGEQRTTKPLSVTIPESAESAQEEDGIIGNEVPGMPIAIGNEAYVGTTFNPYLDPDIINNSADKTVTGFTLAYFGVDSDYRVLTFGDTGTTITYFPFKQVIKPGETISPGKVTLKSYGPFIKGIYVAVSSVTLEDGSTIKVPEEDLMFGSWTLD